MTGTKKHHAFNSEKNHLSFSCFVKLLDASDVSNDLAANYGNQLTNLDFWVLDMIAFLGNIFSLILISKCSSEIGVTSQQL